MFNATFWWAIAGLALIISEFVVPGLILFFFGIGALITALLAWVLPIGIEWQIAIFIICSMASLFGLRHLLKSIFIGRTSGDSEEMDEQNQLKGTHGKVTKDIEPGEVGRVQLNGASWKAVANESIPAETTVEVTAQNNLTLTVKPTK